MTEAKTILFNDIEAKFGEDVFKAQDDVRDEMFTIWSPVTQLQKLLSYLKNDINKPFRMLVDLTAVDMRTYSSNGKKPTHPFEIIYLLLSYERNEYIRIKAGLEGDYPKIPTITDIWPSANWYEREVYDMFGIQFQGHPHLTRILMPKSWKGHPLRKEHPARATEMEPFSLPEDKMEKEEDTLQFKPEEWGMKRHNADSDFMFLNLGPQHPGTHGVLRLVLQLSGEEIIDIAPDIGFHHRGAEKMGERQSWHTYIPYTDRVDYLSGVLNN
ncbi:MAG TPA: NADH-quinone oxidoreductase subunit C, partial [Sunxiuqinia sp.]|nr:NADH-quinone oxidoreductase subunit C [Sunxiuqinia sp.]